MVKNQANTFSCYLVGQTSLLLQCAEILLNKGHIIHGIISSDPNIKQWADLKSMAVYAVPEQIKKWQDFDYIFNVNSSLVLPSNILKNSKQSIINYTDTSKFEKEHVINWQILDGQYVTLKNRSIKIDKSEKIQVVTSRIFTELVEELKNKELDKFSLDLSVPNCDRLTQEEAKKILIDWNQTKTNYPRDKTIPELFEEQVEKRQENIAISYGNESLNYKQLDNCATHVAQMLLDYGIKPGSVVAILSDRSIELVVAMLAILKAGCIYLPIEMGSAPARIEKILVESDAVALFVDKPFLAEAEKKNLAIFYMDNFLSYKNSIPKQTIRADVYATDTAYLMFTSGSTGNPKGVLVPHRGVIRLVVNSNYINFQPIDRMMHGANPAFDAATLEVWGGLLNGIQVVIVDNETLFNISNFKEFLKTQKISIVFLTTSLFHEMISIDEAIFFHLNYLMVGGEALKLDFIRRFFKNPKNVPQHFINMYGPTEITVAATFYNIKNLSQNMTSVPIGCPLSNTQVYILDEKLQPVPIGIIGELYVAGDGVANGYLDKKMTNESFIKNPFSSEGKIYKTGDLVRWLPDGILEYMGRRDDEIKINGYRVDLEDIANTIRSYVDVRDAVVISACNNGIVSLEAYLVSKINVNLNIENLKFYLKQHLSSYMMPAKFIMADKIPLKNNGKVDKAKLMTMYKVGSYKSNTEGFPQTEVEVVRRIWQNLLNDEYVNIDRNIFDQGARSLLVIRACDLIKRQLQVTELNVKDLFAYPTIRSFVEFITNKKNSSAGFGVEINRASIQRARLRAKRGKLLCQN